MKINTATVYECPNGHFEKTLSRAVAWHLVELCKQDDRETLSFSDALVLVEKSQQAVELLKQMVDEDGWRKA